MKAVGLKENSQIACLRSPRMSVLRCACAERERESEREREERERAAGTASRAHELPSALK